MIRKIAASIFILLISIGIAYAQNDCTRFVDKVGGYSLCLPKDWSTAVDEESKLHAFYAPPIDGRATNINFQGTQNSADLESYVTAALAYLEAHTKEFEITNLKTISRANMTTRAKVTGIIVVSEVDAMGQKYHTMQFAVAGEHDRKLVMTCTYTKALSATYEPICRQIADSFQWEPFEVANPLPEKH